MSIEAVWSSVTPANSGRAAIFLWLDGIICFRVECDGCHDLFFLLDKIGSVMYWIQITIKKWFADLIMLRFAARACIYTGGHCNSTTGETQDKPAAGRDRGGQGYAQRHPGMKRRARR